ncbi:MAG: hypothetical protein CSA23_02740 [Deltaproteobacteria bacterium]|nr:MAG: hypothetical protein CSA23_02740 [Deltaproteobacteria bacterium]
MKYDIIVYQMGKVASTSLVETLNQIDGVTAYQSHFLGKENLGLILGILLDPDIADHFSYHGEGQLVKNIQLTRLLHQHEKGIADKRLVILSLSRDPVEWFRSQIQQELDGYYADFFQLANLERPETNMHEAIRIGLARIESGISVVLDTIDDVIGEPGFIIPPLWSKNGDLWEQFGDTKQIIKRHVLTFIRPFYWFDEHIKKNFGIDIYAHNIESAWFHINKSYFDLYICRFEDLKKNQDRIFSIVGGKKIRMEKLNISHDKDYADVIDGSIARWRRNPAICRVYDSAYCRFFGYQENGPTHPSPLPLQRDML